MQALDISLTRTWSISATAGLEYNQPEPLRKKVHWASTPQSLHRTPTRVRPMRTILFDRSNDLDSLNGPWFLSKAAADKFKAEKAVAAKAQAARMRRLKRSGAAAAGTSSRDRRSFHPYHHHHHADNENAHAVRSPSSIASTATTRGSFHETTRRRDTLSWCLAVAAAEEGIVPSATLTNLQDALTSDAMTAATQPDSQSSSQSSHRAVTATRSFYGAYPLSLNEWCTLQSQSQSTSQSSSQ